MPKVIAVHIVKYDSQHVTYRRSDSRAPRSETQLTWLQFMVEMARAQQSGTIRLYIESQVVK